MGAVIGRILAALTSWLLIGFHLPVEADWFRQQRDIMGTRISIELWQQDPQQARRCSEAVFADMRRIDNLMSPYKADSELAMINRDAAAQAVAVSEEMYGLLQTAVEFARLSDGAFDITFASIGQYYDYRRKHQPDRPVIEQHLPSVGYRGLMLENQRVGFARSGMRIDLGGIAKGHAVDRAVAILKQCGAENALVSAGGDSRIIGDRIGRPWMMGIRHPRDPKGIALTIPLSDSAISTSGDYERFFLHNDERIHHIINPQTGRPATESWSVSVIGPDATSTDALSTTLFVLGVDKAMKLVETLEDIDAIIIDAEGKIHYSSGLTKP